MAIWPTKLKKEISLPGFVLAMVLFASPVFAFETSTHDAAAQRNLENLGSQFQPIATQFGCGDFRHADFTGLHSAMLSYAPGIMETQVGPPAPWRKLVTVNYYMLSGTSGTDEALLDHLRTGLFRQFYEGAQILDTKSYRDDAKGPVLYIAYRTGKGDEQQYGAGILMRVSETGAAFIQIQSKGQPIAAAEDERLQDLVKTVVALK